MKRDIAAFEATAAKARREPLRTSRAFLSMRPPTYCRSARRTRRLPIDIDVRQKNSSRRRTHVTNGVSPPCKTRRKTVQAISSGLPDAENPIELRLRLKRRNEALERLSSSRRRFAENAEGQSEDAVRGVVDEFHDRTKQDWKSNVWKKADANHFEEYGELSARLAENVRQRRELETGKTAEHAVFERLSAEEEAKNLLANGSC